MRNKYPVYVLSRGRYENCLTAKFLIKDGVDFFLVVEEQEYDEYASRYEGGVCTILVLPEDSTGRGAIPVRNWIWEHSNGAGDERHWILDDNIRMVRRWYKRKRLECDSGVAFGVVEGFVDRYENIAIAGLNYTMFCTPGSGAPPFNLNVHVYSCMLMRNDLPNRWRGEYNSDTDICLQVLSDGLCTVLFNAFMVDKMTTMLAKGGNTDKYAGDGRLKMAKGLERQWPGVVETKRRYNRPQHVISKNWRRFDTPLIRRGDVDFGSLEPNEYGMTLKKTRDVVKSKSLRGLLSEE